MIRITPNISIDESELDVAFIHSSGPGGQNVNKVATAAQLRFDAAGSPNIPDPVKPRLLALAGQKATADGQIVITAQRYRSQARNRADAEERLIDLIRQAAHRPKKRRKTRPTLASRERRLTAKKQRGEVKRLRLPPRRDP